MNPAALVLCVLGACLVLAAAGAWGWNAFRTYRAEKQAAFRRNEAILEAKARKDAAMLAEIERKQQETSGKRAAAAPEPPAQGWTEVSAK